MVPLRLEIKNFLAYRNPAPLDFTGIHVAVLTGENGAGKSSLLDAMTWALWGKARAKTDTELVHQGQTEMRVEFTFALGQDTYRVIRAKRAGKAAGGLLELQTPNADGKWQNIGEATIPKTQDKLIQLIRLTYDTFSNSAYLMQGKADEFTAKRPTERKQLLADILGLSDWEIYEGRAKDRLKKVDEHLAGVDRVLHEIDEELKHRAEYERDLSAARARMLEVTERLRQAEQGWAQIDAARQAMMSVTRQTEDVTRRMTDARKELDLLDADLREARVRADVTTINHELHATQAKLTEIEKLESEREHVVDAKQRTSEIVAQLTEQNKATEAQANDIKKRIETLQTDAERAQKRLRADIADLEKSVKKQTAAIKDEGERLKQRREAEVEAEASKLLQRAQTLTAATEPMCPLCGQPLTEAQRAQLITDLNTEAEERRAKVHQELHDEAQVRQEKLLEIQIEEKEKQQQLETDLHADEDARRVQVAELEGQVAARREQYKQNQTQLKSLNDDVMRYEKDLTLLNSQLKEKPALLKRVADWQAALSQADAAQAKIPGLAERRERWAAAIIKDETQLQSLTAEAEKLNAILKDSASKQRALDELRKEDTLAKARMGATEQKLAALDDLEIQRAKRQTERADLEKQRGLYDELREAFGKKGVPAMMIESAVPEIESAANVLLARMTSGRMHVRFNTQRETQAGETRETLDIQISDELGTRAYEMYSGGEAFRVNFAIRLALSHLLARRAGTQLQTLIIDEGFGTLDASGRERLVEAINAAQEDFQRILVVTHIDELKDAFPARIEITKGPNGSEIAVA